MNPIVVIWIAAAGFILVQQFQARALNARLLIGIPLVLAFTGAGALTHLNTIDAALFFGLNAAVAVGLGMSRGSSIRVWTEGTQAFQQGTMTTLGLWGISVAVRLALMAAGHLAGLSTAQSMTEIPLLLALTLGAQNLVIWTRAATPATGLTQAA